MNNQFLIDKINDKKIKVSVRFYNDEKTIWYLNEIKKQCENTLTMLFSENELIQNENNTQKCVLMV